MIGSQGEPVGRHRKPDEPTPAWLLNLAFAEWALERGVQAAFYEYRSAAFYEMEAAGMSITEALQTDVERHHDAQALAHRWSEQWAKWFKSIPVVATCTGDHLSGPRRIAGPRCDWCVWCEAPIWLEEPR